MGLLNLGNGLVSSASFATQTSDEKVQSLMNPLDSGIQCLL